eukprot:s699_g41.t1
MQTYFPHVDSADCLHSGSRDLSHVPRSCCNHFALRAPVKVMAPKRAQKPSQGKLPAPSRSKTQAAGKAKASPKAKGTKPAAKSVAVPKSAPKTPNPRTPAAKKGKEVELETNAKDTKAVPCTPLPYRNVEAEVQLRASYAAKQAQLEEALRKAQEMETVACAERSKAVEAEKRAAAAEAFLQEVRERASRAEALQLEVAQAQARAAHAEAKAEVLSELQESFQRNVPEMVRSIAQTIVDCSNRRRNTRSLACSQFRGVMPKLELEDTTDILPLMPVGVAEDLNGHDKASDELMKFYGQGGTEEIPSSADTHQSSQSERPKAASRLKDVAGVLKRVARSASPFSGGH